MSGIAEAIPYRRIGHKGADAIEPGNTLESFEAAIEEGVDMIEFDVARATAPRRALRDRPRLTPTAERRATRCSWPRPSTPSSSRRWTRSSSTAT